MDDEAVLNGSPDELVTEDSPVTTQNGLVTGSSAYKACYLPTYSPPFYICFECTVASLSKFLSSYSIPGCSHG
jgi:hypothetical protein